jgi:hypothetical protein
MPKGVYKRTEEYRKKLKDRLLKIGVEKRFKKGHGRLMTEKQYLGIAKKNKGSKRSDETKIKMRKHNAKYWKGKKQSEQHKKNISNGIKLHFNESGRKTPETILIRTGLEYRLWREAVFNRDNYTCQTCGIDRTEIQAHHKKEFSKFPELRFAIDNGITLCKKCHSLIHNNKYL